MKKTRFVAIALAVIMALALMTGCGNTGSEDGPSAASDVSAPTVELSGTVYVAAAASLENALEEEIIPMFKEANPGAEVTGTYDSSGKLQTQIEEGLEATVFFSAATKQMDALVEGSFVNAEDVVPLLENEIVLITRTDSDTNVTGFENITDVASIAIGDPASVPAGQYAQEALTSFGIWDAVSKVASLGTNVTEVLNQVAEGSAEVGIVYATDAASMADKVKVIASAPEGSLATPVIYPVSKLAATSGADLDATNAFIDFLGSDEAMAVFVKYGFKAAK
jgi:molybdate transport system substrate-binding protein